MGRKSITVCDDSKYIMIYFVNNGCWTMYIELSHTP